MEKFLYFMNFPSNAVNMYIDIFLIDKCFFQRQVSS